MAKPIVDGLERDLEGRAQVVRLSVLSELGREVANRFGVRGLPTFLIFDAEGALVGRRTGLPDRAEIAALLGEGPN